MHSNRLLFLLSLPSDSRVKLSPLLPCHTCRVERFGEIIVIIISKIAWFGNWPVTPRLIVVYRLCLRTCEAIVVFRFSVPLVWHPFAEWILVALKHRKFLFEHFSDEWASMATRWENTWLSPSPTRCNMPVAVDGFDGMKPTRYCFIFHFRFSLNGFVLFWWH